MKCGVCEGEATNVRLEYIYMTQLRVPNRACAIVMGRLEISKLRMAVARHSRGTDITADAAGPALQIALRNIPARSRLRLMSCKHSIAAGSTVSCPP